MIKKLTFCILLSVAYTISPVIFHAQGQEQEQEQPSDIVQHPTVELPDELDRVLRDYEREWKAGNADALAALFSPEGYALPSSRPPFRGREAIAAAYARAGGNLSLRALHFRVEGNIGFIVGAYSYNPENGDTGKFLLALERSDDGRWLIGADIDNGIAGQ